MAYALCISLYLRNQHQNFYSKHGYSLETNSRYCRVCKGHAAYASTNPTRTSMQQDPSVWFRVKWRSQRQDHQDATCHSSPCRVCSEFQTTESATVYEFPVADEDDADVSKSSHQLEVAPRSIGSIKAGPGRPTWVPHHALRN